MKRVAAARAETIVADTFLARLDESERAALSDIGIARAFPRRSMLMFEHEPGDRVMVLLAGRVKVSRVAEDGHDLLFSIRDPGDVVGELAFVDGQPRIATVSALEPVHALVIPVQALRAHLEVTPRVAVVLLEVVTKRFRDTTLKRSELAALDTIGRVAARLLELAERYGEPVDGGIAIASLLSREELAAWAGASRAGVAHAMQTMRELGWIATDRRCILIRDLDALHARAA